MRRAARIDANQPAIVKGLEKHGCKVAITSGVGDGFPDLVVSIRGRNYLMEVKDPAKPPSARKLTPDQQKFRDSWRGQYDVIETLDDALAGIALEEM